MGTTVFGGMLAATTLNLLFIPILYVALRTLQQRRGRGGKPELVGTEEEKIAV